jgi:threonine-phosphate decarboxylase
MHKVPFPYADPAPLFRHGGVQDDRLVLDFSININPLGPPASVVEVLRGELGRVARYPDPRCAALRERLAARHDLHPEQIIVGNGSTELIYAIARACRPRRVAIAEPTFTEYLRASLLVGAVSEHWLAEKNSHDPQPFDPEEAELVWLCNPNNPTGRLWSAAALREWIRKQRRTLFAVDEAFLPFREDDREHSLIAEASASTNLIIIRSMTKVYALPGLRLGYAVTNAALADLIRSQLLPWSVNALAQAAGLAALADSGFLAQTRTWFNSERRSFNQTLDRLSEHADTIPSQANFTLLRLRHGTAAGMAQALAKSGIAVREASNFVGLSERHLRVALRTSLDNERLLDKLRSVFQGPRPK